MEQEKKEMCNITSYINLDKEDFLDRKHLDKLFYYRVNKSHEISIYDRKSVITKLLFNNYFPNMTNWYLSEGDVIGVGLIRNDFPSGEYSEVVIIYLDDKFYFTNIPMRSFFESGSYYDITKGCLRTFKLNKMLNEDLNI